MCVITNFLFAKLRSFLTVWKKFCWTKCNLRSRVEKRTTAVNCGFFTRKNGRFALPIMPLGKHKRVSQVCQPLCQIGTLQDGLVSGSAKTPWCWVTKKLSYEKSWVAVVWRNIFTAIGKSLPPSLLHIQGFISEWLAWRICEINRWWLSFFLQ